MAFGMGMGRSGGGRSSGGRTGGKTGGKRGVKRGKKKFFTRKLRCRFCLNKVKSIDYLEFQNLRRFTTERGKILPSRITGNCAKHQRGLTRAIKRARQAGFMPFLSE